MSSDDQDDDITIVTAHCGEYAASEPGASPHRVKTGKTRLSDLLKRFILTTWVC